MNESWNAPISDRFSSLCARVFSPAASILESEKTLGTRLESVRLNIGFAVVRTDGRAAVYGHVITKFSGMGRFTYPWCSAGALRAPELRYY